MADIMRTSNPALNDEVFRRQGYAVGDTMTLSGTVNKTGILVILAMATLTLVVASEWLNSNYLGLLIELDSRCAISHILLIWIRNRRVPANKVQVCKER